MKFAKMLLTACFLVYFLLVPVSRVASHGMAREGPIIRVPPPPIFRSPPTLRLSPEREEGRFEISLSQFSVNYNGFTPEAREAFEYAVDIWTSFIWSPTQIQIDATFEELDGEAIGRATWSDIVTVGSVSVVVSLANAWAGKDFYPGKADMQLSYNTETEWYYGTDMNPPEGKYDFVTVVLHEIGHGLGFSR